MPDMNILSIDIGGSKVKCLLSGENEPRAIPSGPALSAADMVHDVRRAARGWKYDAVSIGYPGMVGASGPLAEPGNLGPGWVGFDFAAAFDCPVKIVNDAAMQALGTYDGGREKAPAAICRKVIAAVVSGKHEIEIWGDGEQTRSFCYIDDCVTGLYKLMQSDYTEPLNLGQDRLISINELADVIAQIAEVGIIKRHVDGPQGVRGRNSDNTRLREVLNWEPAISLEDGLARTYEWIEQQVKAGLSQAAIA